MSEPWQTDSLGKYCYIKARIGWRGLSASEYKDSGPFLIAGKHIESGIIDWDACDHISEFRYRESVEIALTEGDVILTKDGTIGRVARVDSLPGKATINGTMMLIRPVRGINYRYLYHVLNGAEFKKLIDDKVSGSSIPHIFQRDMVTLPISFPTMEHQAKLAEVLDTLDTAIHETEAIIAKLKAVKQGLLHDLLTRGIDANGELRPPQPEAPHLYKPSPLGWIPMKWELLPVGAMSDVIYGISDAIEMNLDDGIKTITLPCVSASGELSLAPENLVYTAQRKVPESLLLRRGDLLFNWRNGSLNHLGKTAYFDAVGSYTHVGFLLRVRAKTDVCLPEFLCSVLRYAKDTGVFLRAKGQVNNTFNSEELRSLRLVFPSVTEQRLISARLDALDRIQETERAMLEKLTIQKAGLMDDLLTGRVRVTPLLEAASP